MDAIERAKIKLKNEIGFGVKEITNESYQKRN